MIRPVTADMKVEQRFVEGGVIGLSPFSLNWVPVKEVGCSAGQ